MAYLSGKGDLTRPKRKRSFIAQSWWVAAFLFLASGVYLHASAKKEVVLSQLDCHLAALQEEKAALVRDGEDLLLQVGSQSDPAWIQLTLMKGLGLVPEGQQKVYFHNEEE